MISELIDIIVDLNDVGLFLFDEILQLFQIILVNISEAVRFKLLHSLFLEPIDDPIDLLSLWRIVRELLLEDFLVLLDCSVESGCPLILRDLLPG